MRILLLFCLVVLSNVSHVPQAIYGEDPQAVSLATHNRPQEASPTAYAEATKRIRKIVLNQGDDARALANLVQLTRKLPAAVTSQLYFDLANDYLQRGTYDQAANVLQQLLTQHPNQPITSHALVRLIRLYSSSEVNHTQQAPLQQTPRQQTKSASADGQQGLLKYALYTTDRTLQNNPTFGDQPALIFQRSVATRLSGQQKAAQGRLTQLKHKAAAGSWRTCALAEQWLQSDREESSPKPVVVCSQSSGRPHLDGVLNESMWRDAEPVQFAYDDAFLYLAIAYPKVEGLSYQADARPRSHDAELAEHDHLRLRLDLDRDYATCFELAVDHRGWTHDRCWLDAGWNLKWFVAAGGDASQWTVEAAIPWESLTHIAPRSGEAWAVSLERMVPGSVAVHPVAEAPSPGDGVGDFSLLLFD